MPVTQELKYYLKRTLEVKKSSSHIVSTGYQVQHLR